MIKNAMSLKAKINNIAIKKKLSPQSVMQMYMLERLLERISKSRYKDYFILKGGMLITSIVGLGNRSTMDMDTTIKGFSLNEGELKKVITEIINIDVQDNIKFKILKLSRIRDDDEYGGLRMMLEASFDDMPVILKIDVTTGDKITYKEIEYKYNLMLEDKSIEIWTYNVETIMAEKYECTINRGDSNTRIRDYYDLYMLVNVNNNWNEKILALAIRETAKHRGSFKSINDKEKVENIIEVLKKKETLKNQWKDYQTKFKYASNIDYEDTISAIEHVKDIYFKYHDII